MLNILTSLAFFIFLIKEIKKSFLLSIIVVIYMLMLFNVLKKLKIEQTIFFVSQRLGLIFYTVVTELVCEQLSMFWIQFGIKTSIFVNQNLYLYC